MMIGSVVWSRDEVVQGHCRQGSQAVCWRGGPHKALKSSRVMGELWERGRPWTEAKVLTDEGQSRESALGSDSLESGGLPSHQCQLCPSPRRLCKCHCCKSQIESSSVSSWLQSCLGVFFFGFHAWFSPLLSLHSSPG